MSNSKKIENFWGGDYITSSPDLIAVKGGLKNVARMECNDWEDFKKIKKDFSRDSLKVVCSDEKLFNKLNIYISKSEKLANEAKRVDPSFKLINYRKQFAELTDDIHQFSKLMSYPDCCIKKYIKNVSNNTKISTTEAFLRLPKKINFLFNNILNGVSNHYLSFHFPCSFTCQKTLDYQRKIFNKIKQTSLPFAKEIEDYLKRPYLVFLEPLPGNIYVSWDKRKGFIFDGFIKNNSLIYSETVYFQTNYPDYHDTETANKEFDVLMNKIRQGNKIIFRKDNFQIYRDKGFLYNFKNTKNNQAFLFNFV